jgi:long-subunit fatty acid transport protein
VRSVVLIATLLVATATLIPRRALADAPGTFGFGPRSAALVRSDIAGDQDATAAARDNPALAAGPGSQLRIGYAYSSMSVTLNGLSNQVLDVSGVDLAAKLGRRVNDSVSLGLAFALHLPDRYAARVAFHPASEPQLPVLEAPLQRTTFDVAAAFRVGPLSLGGGLSAEVDLSGNTDFHLGQDAGGTHADARFDVEIPYHLTPILGARWDFGERARLGLSFRGPIAIGLREASVARVDLASNPLNGVTTVTLDGSSGYDPASLVVGTNLRFGMVSVAAAFDYAFYRYSPAPVADVALDVHLGTTPTQRILATPPPGFHDTLTPRLGVEFTRRGDIGSDGKRDSIASLRAGYAYVPSPVPKATGLTSYLDATRHVIGLGGGGRLGRVFGVEMHADLAAQLHFLVARDVEKPDPALPHATLSTSGTIAHGAFALTGAFR